METGTVWYIYGEYCKLHKKDESNAFAICVKVKVNNNNIINTIIIWSCNWTVWVN